LRGIGVDQPGGGGARRREDREEVVGGEPVRLGAAALVLREAALGRRGDRAGAGVVQVGGSRRPGKLLPAERVHVVAGTGGGGRDRGRKVHARGLALRREGGS